VFPLQGSRPDTIQGAIYFDNELVSEATWGERNRRCMRTMSGLLIARLREGKWNCRGCGRGVFTGFIEDSERLREEICCTGQCDVNLLECLFPSPFLIEDLKTAMLFVHDRLFRVQHKTIDGCHRGHPFV
jgi:hypothetical protein